MRNGSVRSDHKSKRGDESCGVGQVAVVACAISNANLRRKSGKLRGSLALLKRDPIDARRLQQWLQCGQRRGAARMGLVARIAGPRYSNAQVSAVTIGKR